MASGRRGRITIAGRVSDNHLARLYADADVFVLPCVEAADGDIDGAIAVMEAGKPRVIASREGSRDEMTISIVSPADPARYQGQHTGDLKLSDAAGVAAAVAVQDSCRPRDVDVAKVQKVLRQQEAYLG